MPIVVNLDVMLARRNMRHSELSNLKTGKARAVRFSTLAAICEVLQCQPGDVLELIPEPAVTKP